MNLEHLRLLNVRGARLERGSGGQPEITWDDVAMMLLSISRTAAAYARYRYAGDSTEWHAIRRGMIATIYVSDEWSRNSNAEYWETLIALGLKAFCSGEDLSQKERHRQWVSNGGRQGSSVTIVRSSLCWTTMIVTCVMLSECGTQGCMMNRLRV